MVGAIVKPVRSAPLTQPLRLLHNSSSDPKSSAASVFLLKCRGYLAVRPVQPKRCNDGELNSEAQGSASAVLSTNSSQSRTYRASVAGVAGLTTDFSRRHSDLHGAGGEPGAQAVP